MSWDVSGSGLGTFLDGFGKVLEKMSDEVRKSTFSKMVGNVLPESGRFRISFLAYPRSKNTPKSKKHLFTVNFRIFLYRGSAAWRSPLNLGRPVTEFMGIKVIATLLGPPGLPLITRVP